VFIKGEYGMISENYKYWLKKVLLFSLMGMIFIILTAKVPLAHSNLKKSEELEVFKGIGGNFTLYSSHNQNASLKDFQGNVVMMSFGYTFCPDTCPITLTLLKQVIEKFNKGSDQVQTLFITVDPKRDTPEHMKNYLSSFHPNFIGLTGTKKEILEVAEKYGSAYMKNPTIDSESNYLMIHTGYVYLIDQSGKVRAIYPKETEVNQIVNDIKGLLVSG
jgi:protein SCO1/2